MITNSPLRAELSSEHNDQEDIMPFAWESNLLRYCRLSSGAGPDNASLSQAELSKKLVKFKILLHPSVGLTSNSIATGCLKRLHRMRAFPDFSEWEDEDYFQLALDFICAYISNVKVPKLLRDETALKNLTRGQTQELLGNMMWMMVLNTDCPSRLQPKVVGMLIDVDTFQVVDILNNLRDLFHVSDYVAEALEILKTYTS